MTNVEAFERLIGGLEAALAATGLGTNASGEATRGPSGAANGAGADSSDGDAIDRVLASKPRSTVVRSLRDDAAIQRFRDELADGLIRADTAGKALDALVKIVAVLAAGRA
jgi:hypothetical protein